MLWDTIGEGRAHMVLEGQQIQNSYICVLCESTYFLKSKYLCNFRGFGKSLMISFLLFLFSFLRLRGAVGHQFNQNESCIYCQAFVLKPVKIWIQFNLRLRRTFIYLFRTKLVGVWVYCGFFLLWTSPVFVCFFFLFCLFLIVWTLFLHVIKICKEFWIV